MNLPIRRNNIRRADDRVITERKRIMRAVNDEVTSTRKAVSPDAGRAVVDEGGCPSCGLVLGHEADCELQPSPVLDLDADTVEVDTWTGRARTMIASEARMHRRIRDRIEPDEPYTCPDEAPPGWPR